MNTEECWRLEAIYDPDKYWYGCMKKYPENRLSNECNKKLNIK